MEREHWEYPSLFQRIMARRAPWRIRMSGDVVIGEDQELLLVALISS